MASPTLVDQIQRILEQVRTSKGEFTLAMLYSSFEGGEGGWNLILSAVWTDGMDTGEAIQLFADVLRNSLTPESVPSISRITVLPTTDPFVLGITSAFAVAGPGSTIYISNSTFGGVQVQRGILFYSQRPVPAGPR